MNAQQFGERVAAQRMIRKWSLRDLTQVCGVSYGNLSRMERGLTDVSLSTAQKIAAAFGMSLVELINDAPMRLSADQYAVLNAYAAGDLDALTRLALARIDALKASAE